MVPQNCPTSARNTVRYESERCPAEIGTLSDRNWNQCPTAPGIRTSNPKSEASAAAIPILSPNEFTQELAAALRKLGPPLNPKVTKHLEMAFTLRSGQQMTVGTFGLYNRYLVTPHLKDEIIVKFCTIALSAAKGVGLGSGPMEE